MKPNEYIAIGSNSNEKKIIMFLTDIKILFTRK